MSQWGRMCVFPKFVGIWVKGRALNFWKFPQNFVGFQEAKSGAPWWISNPEKNLKNPKEPHKDINHLLNKWYLMQPSFFRERYFHTRWFNEIGMKNPSVNGLDVPGYLWEICHLHNDQWQICWYRPGFDRSDGVVFISIPTLFCIMLCIIRTYIYNYIYIYMYTVFI